MDAGSEPSLGERTHYFGGLPSSPLLVARSSTTRWSHRSDGWATIRKSLRTVGDHPIVAPWNDADHLRTGIVGLLERHCINWHSIDVLRIAYDDVADADAPVVLLISVEPASLSHQLGRMMATQCQMMLVQHHLPDVECEIKESRLVRLTKPKNIVHIPAATEQHYMTYKHEISDFAGTAIAVANSNREGTRGIYLREAGTNAVYALTCRHVCFGQEDFGELLPGSLLPSPLEKRLVQPGDTRHQELVAELDGMHKHYTEQLSKLEERILLDDMDERSRRWIQSHRDGLSELKPCRTEFQSRSHTDNRVFGRVGYVREYSLGTHGQLHDWALIRLDADCFERPLSELSNRVYAVYQQQHLRTLFPFVQPKDFLVEPDANGIIQLNGFVPIDDFANPLVSGFQYGPTPVVVKRGRGTGLTFGLHNQVRSVTRVPHGPGHPSFICLEWCVIGHSGRPKGANPNIKDFGFSAAGDSGSCIWDLAGRVVGMITSGNSREEVLCGDQEVDTIADVTYFTPMEWLLEEFSRCGMHLSIL